VSVSDEGEGIPPEELPRVTGKFYRGKSVAEKVKGSGLGLYLSKYFIELHQGRLEIKSEVGKGTEVSFWLPISSP
jgi:signal transduction histidine kinase